MYGSNVCNSHIYIPANSSIPSFTAYQEEGTIYSPGDVIPFSSVIYNEGGRYDGSTGLFTCPVHGIYMFHYSVQIQIGYEWGFHLKRSGEIVSSGMGFDFYQSSNLVFLECDVGAQVWMEANGSGTINGDEERRYTSFTGALMRAL